MLSSTSPLRIVLSLSIFVTLVFGSVFTTFSDASCQKSLNNINAVNGYPDGVCTRLSLGGNTFQIAQLDDGCAVTLYGPDTGPQVCSADLKIVADPATCYNASWAYYSVDGCAPPKSSTVILPTITPSTSTPSSSAATTASSSASASSTPKATSTGIIVGGIVGGVSVLALVLGIILFCLRRNRKRQCKPLPPPPSYEMSNEGARVEMSYPEKILGIRQGELWGHDAVMEMGRNSLPPVELAADEALGEDKKGLRPIVQMHIEQPDPRNEKNGEMF